MQAARTPLRSAALLILATAGFGAQPSPPPYSAPTKIPAVLQAEADESPTWDDLVQQDGRIGFTPRTGDLARAVLEREVSSPSEYAAAMMAAAMSRSLHLRHHLESAAVSENVDLRRAALLALGELGPRIGNAESLLHDALADPRAVGCALYALFRVDPESATRTALELADSERPGSFFAARIATWDGAVPGPDCIASRIRLSLRWGAARRFGTIDGQSWSMILIEELKQNQLFLEHFVLMQAAGLGGPVVRDHLATLLVEAPSRVLVQACVRSMHRDLDQMLGSGAWVPGDDGLWLTLVNEAVRTGAARDMPQAMRLAGSREALQPLALPFLAKYDEDILEKVLLDMESPKANRRRMTVRGVGAAALVPAVRKLYAMESDKNPAVRAEAWVVRCRLGDAEAAAHLREMLTRPLGREPDPVFLRERELSQQALLFHAAGRPVQNLMLDVVDRMSIDDERLPYYLAALRIEGHAIDGQLVIDALTRRDVLEGRDELLIRAIGYLPGSVALAHLTERFPSGGTPIIDLELANALVGVSSPEVEALLAAAVFGENWHFGVLAAAVVEEHYGQNALMLWALQPPEGTGPAIMRRLGFAIGEIGRLDALEELTRRLGHGSVDRPVLQGALLGALSARSH